MRDLINMWKYPRMIILTAVTAAVYALGLYIFNYFIKFPLAVRPATGFALVSGLMFGPAGAFGSAIGNFLFDIRNDIDFGTPPGIIGNFLLAYVPYRLMKSDQSFTPQPRLKFRWIGWYIAFSLIGAGSCGGIIGSMFQIIKEGALPEIGGRIFLGNWAMALMIGPLILLLYKKINQSGWTFEKIMRPADFYMRKRRYRIGSSFLAVGIACFIGPGIYFYLGKASPTLSDSFGNIVQTYSDPSLFIIPIVPFLIGLFLI